VGPRSATITAANALRVTRSFMVVPTFRSAGFYCDQSGGSSGTRERGITLVTVRALA
jgi:hypothetical protein